jgi:hypothetical protein
LLWAIAILELLTVAALWLAMQRLRRWKEQILYSNSVLNSNSHLDQVATRQENAAAVRQIVGEELAGIRENLRLVRERGDLRELVRREACGRRLPETPAPNGRYAEFVEFLQSLDHENDGAGGYLAAHLHRIARTFSMTPEPFQTGRALELGAYMLMTPALGCLLRYREVRGHISVRAEG